MQQNIEINHAHLVKASGVTVEDLRLLDFSNQEIFNSSGIAFQNE